MILNLSNIKVRETILSAFTLIFVILLLIRLPANAQQEVADYQNKKLQLEKEIEYTNALIEHNSETTQITLADLSLLQHSIDARMSLIQLYQDEQQVLYDTIFTHLICIHNLSEKINRLRDEYSRMIKAAYRQRNPYFQLFNIASAGSFHQAINRLNMLRTYTSRRKAHINSIVSTEKKYDAAVVSLEKKIEANELLIADLQLQTSQLNENKIAKQKSISELEKMRKQLLAQNRHLQHHHHQLKLKIDQLLLDEMELDIDGSLHLKTDVSEEQLSALFEVSMGKLPWPSQEGVLALEFGEYQHPDLKWVKIKNNGVNVMTRKGAKARAVFDGVVTRVVEVPNFYQVVILRHGEYLTVYSNLIDVEVQSGQHVKAKCDLGTIVTNSETDRTELHFEIWRGKDLLDPMLWLLKQQDAVQFYQYK